MIRRELLKIFPGVALASSSLPNLLSENINEFDKYGGWKGKKFKATGYFRAEKDKRWWLVTPDGNAFLSFGINHLHGNMWRLPHNKKQWAKILNLNEISNRSDFELGLHHWFHKISQEVGFNTVGVHNDLHIINTPQTRMAYIQPFKVLDNPHWKDNLPDENFLDVFETSFKRKCDDLAIELVAPRRNDPFLLGYYLNDCPLYTEEDCRERTNHTAAKRRGRRIGWPRRLRNLGADAPGKQVYVQTIKKLYNNSIHDFNQTYQTQFESFSDLAEAKNWRPETDLSNYNETRDNVKFLHVVLDHYYKCAHDAIKKHDPNHMFFGDKLNGNTDSVDTVLSITSKYTDVIFYQLNAKYEIQEPAFDRWTQRVDLPIFNGDSSFSHVTENSPQPYGSVALNMQQRIEWTEEFFHKAFSRPEFVGWHFCGLVESDNRVKRNLKYNRQRSGIFDTFGNPHHELNQVIKKCSDQLYQIALSKI